MSQWVKTDINFDLPMMCLVLRVSDTHRLGINLFGLIKDGPAVAEKVVCDIIEEHRPDLMGGILIAMAFSTEIKAWEFWYMHRSLEKIPDTGKPQRMFLISGWITREPVNPADADA